jgi:CBS domain-containing protein
LTGLADVDATKLLHPVGRIGMSKSIGDIIGKYREKYSVDTDLPLREVIGFMHDKNIGAVAVCEGDKVVGVFSERDLLRRVVYKRLDLDRVQLRDVMSSPAYWISIDERYEVAKAIMIDKGLRHLVVKDGEREFRGFVSSRELLEADLSDSRDLVGKLNDEYYQHQFQP